MGGSQLQGISRIQLHDGNLEEFKRLIARFMEVVRTEDSGTLQFDIYLNDDESEFIVLERYRDFDALMEHSANVGELAQEIFALGSVTSACLGEPSALLHDQLAASEVPLFTPYVSL